MPSALIIVFGYNHELPGAPTDLSYVNNWAKTRIKADITLVSDMEDTDALIVSNEEDMKRAILRMNYTADRKVFVYFSGHGTEKGIKLPDSFFMNFIVFRNLILSMCPKDSQVFWVMDCCHASLGLPYKLKENVFRLEPSFEAVEQSVILFTSSIAESYSSREKGSLFTFHLFSEIRTGKRNLMELKNNITTKVSKWKHQQTNVFCSYVFYPVLWQWVLKKQSYTIDTDDSLSVFIIKP